MFCFWIFTTSCRTSCSKRNISWHVTDDNAADRSPVYDNTQVVGNLNLKWGQHSDWLWNLTPLYWKRQASASFNSLSARRRDLTCNSPECHAMYTQSDPSFTHCAGSGGLSSMVTDLNVVHNIPLHCQGVWGTKTNRCHGLMLCCTSPYLSGAHNRGAQAVMRRIPGSTRLL